MCNFSQAKLRCLHDYHLRLLHNVVPAPSGVDIANTIKYFSQTFLSEFFSVFFQSKNGFSFSFFFVQSLAVLKDVPNSPHQIIKDPSQDHIRMSAYPNLEYGNLYNALAMLLDVASNIQFGLNGICCLFMFDSKLFKFFYLSNFWFYLFFQYLAKPFCSVWDVFCHS